MLLLAESTCRKCKEYKFSTCRFEYTNKNKGIHIPIDIPPSPYYNTIITKSRNGGFQLKEKLEYYFKTLLEVFSTEQTVYILLYNLFSLYLENSQNWDCISGEDSQLFYEKKLVELFRDADSYDVKQAAWTLDRMIDWDFINKYEPVRKKLLNVVESLRNMGIHTTEELNEGIEASGICRL